MLRPVTPLRIVAAHLERLRESSRSLGYDDPEFVRVLDVTTELAGGLDGYTEEMTTAPSAALAELVRVTERQDWSSLHDSGRTAVALESEMLSGHVEGRFLNVLVKATRARRVLEIGLFTGYSALAMAEALPDDGTLVACELDAFAASTARANLDRSPHGGKIRIELGPAIDSLARLQAAGDTFDLVFIDADKAGYVAYFEAIVGGTLLAEHGLICVDNTLMQGQPYLRTARTHNGEAIAAFNRTVAADPRVEQVLLPIRDGLTLITRSR